ncbi:Mitochondrial beta-keto-acyl synthase [Orbilia ellipsospora]|uniref:3-oxoacyl-[acyl-carrier-protein] synthase n=1 Tax=Orbilia ellipsospora TaxID=2528407 RepID=A0AAV9XRI1_9PEZI
MRRRVVVTGLGCITPLGVGTKTSWSRLIQGKCGVVSTKGLSQGVYESIPCKVAAVVPTVTATDASNAELSESERWCEKRYAKEMDIGKCAKFSQYAIIAAKEALEDAGFGRGRLDDGIAERVGVCIGSGIGSFEDVYETTLKWANKGYRSVSPLFVPRLLINMAAGHVSMKYNIKGPNHAASTACTTGLHSIGDASYFIQRGTADIMLAGGAEASIHPLAIAGFARARALSTEFNDAPQQSSRPFDSKRCGFVMGEGAGVLVIEELEHARQRGARIYAEVAGYGLSADAWHITAPPADGDGAFRSMRGALKDAEIEPGSVDYVNAHATGTKLGDAAENMAIKRLLVGEGGRKAGGVNVSSIKGAIGHLLGAAGAVESIMSILAIHEGKLPPTINLERAGDPPEDFDCNYIPNETQDSNVDVALCNSFGFGGTNASICFTKYSG